MPIKQIQSHSNADIFVLRIFFFGKTINAKMRVKLQAMKMRMETQDIGSKMKSKCRINLAVANAGLAKFTMVIATQRNN